MKKRKHFIIPENDRAETLRKIARNSDLFSANKDELNATATKLAQLLKYVTVIARMKTTDEFGENQPASDDWAETLDNLIANGRKLLKSTSRPQEDSSLNDLIASGGLPEAQSRRS